MWKHREKKPKWIKYKKTHKHTKIEKTKTVTYIISRKQNSVHVKLISKTIAFRPYGNEVAKWTNCVVMSNDVVWIYAVVSCVLIFCLFFSFEHCLFFSIYKFAKFRFNEIERDWRNFFYISLVFFWFLIIHICFPFEFHILCHSPFGRTERNA